MGEGLTELEIIKLKLVNMIYETENEDVVKTLFYTMKFHIEEKEIAPN